MMKSFKLNYLQAFTLTLLFSSMLIGCFLFIELIQTYFLLVNTSPLLAAALSFTFIAWSYKTM